MINEKDWTVYSKLFSVAEPFNYVLIDDFWSTEVANQLVKDIPDYESDSWNAHYENAIEDKKACNDWNKFPETTYRAFNYLNSPEFISVIKQITGVKDVLLDIGLHGGGWHSHHKGGKLNIHLDYNIHPKLKLQRKFNLIVYMTPEWNEKWGGGLELWSHNKKTKKPNELIVTIENRFNRAILFDTTQNSWHGLPDELSCPEGVYRQSIAVYYMIEPQENADSRGKALFVPHKNQINDPEILTLIEKRSNVNTASKVWRK